MLLNRLRRKGVCMIAMTICTIVIVRMFTKIRPQSPLAQRPITPLRIIKSSAYAHDWTKSNETHCTTGKVGQLSVPICTYSAQEDPILSGYMQNGKYFEHDWVAIVVKLLQSYSTSEDSASFIDIGANIGIYSLAAVHAGHHVIAVEPNNQTIRHLATSVRYGRVSDRIVLLQNAVTNVSDSSLYVLTDLKNRGDTRVSANISCENRAFMEECRHLNVIQTITLNDILSLRPVRQSTTRWRVVMKVDAQGCEVVIFDPNACSRFLDEVDVLAIQVEWNMIQRDYVNQQTTVNVMLKNLYDRNYVVHSVGGNMAELNIDDWLHWPPDVMFFKKPDVKEDALQTPTTTTLAPLTQRSSPLRIIDPSTYSHNWTKSNETHCTTGKVGNLSVPICTYSAQEDPILSGYMQNGKYFEHDWVAIVVKLLKSYSTPVDSASFIDIGSNIGIYSLAAVHAGHHVIAVEPNNQTMRHLATSVRYGRVSDRIVLLQNAVTNVSNSSLYVLTDLKNRGDTRVSANISCENRAFMEKCRHLNVIRTITLNDILSLRPVRQSATRWRVVMKVDAQGCEVVIFDPNACSRFLDEVDVLAIQVEWNMIQRDYVNQQTTVNGMLKNLYDRNYVVHSVGGNMAELNKDDWLHWPPDVMFFKKNKVARV